MSEPNENRIVVEPKPMTGKNVFFIVIGSAVYACAVNLFLEPLNLYAGGIPGLSQLLSRLFFSHINGVNTAGIINLLFNIPLFLLAFKSMHPKVLYGTILSVIVQTLIFTFLPIPSMPILDDKLASIMIAGLSGGCGCGIVLTNGGSAGGLDLLGIYVTSRDSHFSVGRLSIGFNAVLYLICAFLYELSTAVYSVLFVVFFSFAIDRFHYQNIEVQLMVFTHHPEAADVIMKKYVRGVTRWKGEGAYTNRETNVLVTIVAKNEVESVRSDILSVDPHAFIIASDHVQVAGGYQKRLDD